MAEMLIINGTEKQFQQDQLPGTLAELLEQMNINKATVAAEVDGRIVERKSFDKTPLKAGQSVELVRFMGGG